MMERWMLTKKKLRLNVRPGVAFAIARKIAFMLSGFDPDK